MWIYHVMTVATVLVSLLTVAYLYVTHQFSFWAKKRVPFRKPHFIFGNFGDSFLKKASMGTVMMDLYNGFKGERFGGVWEIFTPKLFVLDPNLIRHIMVKDFSTWSHRGVHFNVDVDPLENHLFNLDGKKWKLVRTKLTPTFSSAKLKNMHYLLLECGKDFEKFLNTVATSNKPVEASDMAAKFTTDVIGSCVFGIQMNSLNDEDALFRKMGRKIFEFPVLHRVVPIIQHGFPWLFKFLKLSTMEHEPSDFFIKLTKDTFDYRERNNIQRQDFMDLLRSLKNTGGSLGEDDIEFDDILLASQAFAFFAGGFHTSSTTLSFCLHELAVNENIQDRLREEVHRLKAKNNGEISWDCIKNMKFLQMVIQETLRKYPVAPEIQRMSVKPYQIPDTNVQLPAGIKSIIPIYALHHDPEYFPDPEKFDPERFTEEAKLQRPKFAYIPFGGGPRHCIGQRFAEQQMKMALVKVVENFKVSLCEKSQNPLRLISTGLLLQPEIGVWLKISHNVLN